MEIVVAPLPPGWRLTLAGDAAMVKLPLMLATVRLMVVLLCRLPDVPVIVIVEFPMVAELVAVSVNVLD